MGAYYDKLRALRDEYESNSGFSGFQNTRKKPRSEDCDQPIFINQIVNINKNKEVNKEIDTDIDIED